MIANPVRWLALALTTGLLLGLAACSATPAAPAQAQAAPAKGWSVFLSQYQWQLASASGQNGRPLENLAIPPGSAIQARFAGDARLNISGGCNGMSGGYRVTDAGALTVSQMVATRRACAEPLMQIDAALGHLLAQPVQLSQDDTNPSTPRLTMRSANGSILVWTGKLTPEAQYGAATTVFYEVGPERLSCPHPLMRNATCLQVREIHYDTQGLVSAPPGAWQNLYQEIEGYSHTPGVRQVLRIKRYQRPQPLPADASSVVLVLDLVVRTETVTK
ncbi:DUF4377 domain-containing protein [Variovorax sp. HJSM1_2]|uniref:DUF4377 domain-containing protein n=1 Tax=Variovorax sp. HJSM1_2 TaxID=3366263 RepID=UPI003BD5E7F9